MSKVKFAKIKADFDAYTKNANQLFYQYEALYHNVEDAIKYINTQYHASGISAGEITHLHHIAKLLNKKETVK